jgi:DUF1365 family protein
VSSALYRGELMHARRDAHARRVFRYPICMAAIDLAELPDLHLRLFSHNRRNLFALDDRDYEGGLAGHAALYAANGLPVPARTRLVTNLRAFGYVFNPVSFFLGYDAAGALETAIAEVNNTYGGRRRYVLGPAQRLPGPRFGFRHVRELFVSPFLHGDYSYDFWFDAPLDGDLAIEMHVHDGEGHRVFTARATGVHQPLTDRALAAAALRFPLMGLRVIGLIHYEAVKLRLAGVPYHRPGPDHRPRS